METEHTQGQIRRDMKKQMKKLGLWCLSALLLLPVASCQDNDEDGGSSESQTEGSTGDLFFAKLEDGLVTAWSQGDSIALFEGGTASLAEVGQSGDVAKLATGMDAALSADNPLWAVYPVSSAVSSNKESVVVNVPDTQTATDNGYDAKAAVAVSCTVSDSLQFHTVNGGIKLNLQMTGVTKVEVECVDNYPLAGTATVTMDAQGLPQVTGVENANSIITFLPNGSEFVPGKDYYISTLPCDVYGGYRLSIYKDRQVADYYGVHQTINRADYISPSDLVESDLEFADIDAPFVEDERPELDATTKALLTQYQKNPTEENKQALMDQMGIRYDKVVARKKAKLRELEREALTPDLVEEMQDIVDEMVENRETRLEEQFLRLVDPRTDDNANDAWMVLRGDMNANNAYIGYAPVTNNEYAAFESGFTYDAGQEDYPVVNVSVAEAQAYCDWLSSNDSQHEYRLPTDEEWILAAGHMPKDVSMNADHVESGLTAVDAYGSTTGACGGIDFWGNCWEWTTSTTTAGMYIVKGGAWDSSRDDCRSEVSDIVRDGTQGYANVGFRVVRTDR
jgi:hypothetical protein